MSSVSLTRPAVSSLLPAPFARALTRRVPDTDRIAEYEMKLMDIDVDTLNIPDTDYDARVTMPSSEFGRIVRDLSLLGESVRIEVSKEGVRFISDGEAANGNILLKQPRLPARALPPSAEATTTTRTSLKSTKLPTSGTV